MIKPRALTIAGSDSGGGAGIQADLKTFSALGVHGMSVITSLTAQNTQGVFGIFDVPPDFVQKQFEVIYNDIGIDAAKTGMLSSKTIIDVIANKIGNLGFPLVVDPVMVSKTGSPLINEDAIESLKKKLIPISTIITPNKFEVEKLSNVKVFNNSDLEKAALKVNKEYSVNIVAKGGGIKGSEDVVDIVIINGRVYKLSTPRIETNNLHGSGCVFSAAITSFLAKKFDLLDAVKKAKNFIVDSLKFSLSLGKGIGPVNPIANMERVVYREKAKREIKKLIREMLKNWRKVESFFSNEDISNIAIYTDYDEIATLGLGIIKYMNRVRIYGPIVFNVENFVSRMLKTKINEGYKVCITLGNCTHSSLKLLSSIVEKYDNKCIIFGRNVEEVISGLIRNEEFGS
jgi:hydroxymethylpyrimidine kinase/phosphomethylpyrimidine kinase